MYYTNIPDETQRKTIDELIKVVEERKKMGYKPKQIIQSYDIDLTTDMLKNFKIYGFLNKNKLSEKMNHLEKCGYTEFQLAKYARSYMIDENMHISIFLSRIKDIYAIQTSGIKDLKELIKTYNPKEIDLIQNIEEHNPDDNNLTQDIDLTENTKEWMKLFKRCLEVLNDVKTRKDTYSDGYNTDNTDNTDTESLIDNEDNKDNEDNENKLKK